MLEIPGVEGAYWRTGVCKASVFSVTYGAVWLAIEWSQVFEMFQVVGNHLLGSKKKAIDVSFQYDD